MKTPIENALLGKRTIMKKFTPDTLLPSYRFHYHQGIFLTGAERAAELTQDNDIYSYIKAWVDFNIDSNGNVPNCYITEFDDIQPANLLFGLHDNMTDKDTGLMYHMWDDSKAHPAVDKNTGLVPIC